MHHQQSILKCLTPNPCIECNRNIKFGELLQKMRELGADYLATGHYARKAVRKKSGKEIYILKMAKDKVKDQSYFLYTLSQEKLRHILFPIGGYTKEEVRKMADKFGLSDLKNKKESQGACFFPEKTHEKFLKRYLSERELKPGPIKTTKGEMIGEHEGLALYTIGQRKGIKIGGEHDPWYVVDLDRKHNSLIVGKNKEVFDEKLNVTNLAFTNGKIPPRTSKIKARIRHRFPVEDAVLNLDTTSKNVLSGELKFIKPQRAITPGQSIVFYKGEEVVGGGVISL